MLQGALNEYQLGERVARNDRFEIFFATPADNPKRLCLIVVAQEGKNPIVDRWAYILTVLAEHAARLEEEYQTIRTDPSDVLNYQLGFPILVEAFKSPENQQIMVLAFEYSTPSEMVPIAKMIRKERLRVDLKTSVWVMGKLLKTLSFAHSQGLSVGVINTGTILIDPERHYVNVFDWSAAQISSSLTDQTKRKEIAQAGEVVIRALGGDVTDRMIPNDTEGDKGERYCAHLWTLVDGLFVDAAVAHKSFYQLVDTLWERGYHPFTALHN